jgi:hypothetical protein
MNLIKLVFYLVFKSIYTFQVLIFFAVVASFSVMCHRFSLSLFIFHGHVPASIPTPAQRLSSRLMRLRALMAVMRPYR